MSVEWHDSEIRRRRVYLRRSDGVDGYVDVPYDKIDENVLLLIENRVFKVDMPIPEEGYGDLVSYTEAVVLQL